MVEFGDERRWMMPKQLDSLRLVFLGGVGEIGMNCMAIETADGIVIVDCGVMFAGERDLGAELILPDLRYMRANRTRIKAVIVTHGHEDHIGAIPLVFGDTSVPVYAPKFAGAVLREKCAEYPGSLPARMHRIGPGDRLDVLGMTFQFYRVTHSIPDALGFILRTPMGNIVHTGDFRIDEHPTLGETFDKETLKKVGDEGVLLLLSDSTNVEKAGHTGSEREAVDGIMDIVERHPGRVLISMFSSNIERVGLLAKAAQRVNRRFGLVGRSLYTYSRAALESGYAPFDPGMLVAPSFAEELPGPKLMLLVAGSQGEPRSSLTRVSAGGHPDITIRESDLVIMSSRIIPGNERDIGKVMNDLARAGATVYYEGNAKVHVSGHAQQDELREVLELVRPKFFIPVHGEYRFLRLHAALAKQWVQAQSVLVDLGDMVTVTADSVKVTGKLEVQPFYVENSMVGNAEELKLRERKKLLYHGMVVVRAKALKKKKTELVDADIALFGVPDPDGSLTTELKQAVKLEFADRVAGLSRETVESELEAVVRRVVKRRQERKPLVYSVIEGIKSDT